MGSKTIWNGFRCALAIFSGKKIYNFAFVAACGLLQTLFSREESWPGAAATTLVSCGNIRAAGERSPERADFPRPGEDVTEGDKKGNLSRSD